MAKIITANATRDGQPLYRQARGAWTPTLGLARVLDDAGSAEQALDDARAEEAQVCDPYLIDVEQRGTLIVPTSFREHIRSTGPTVAIP